MRIAVVRSPTRSYSRPTSFAATSVSVSERNSTPSASSSFFSAWKFSMIPLWISASRSDSPPRWGCALPSVGPPWVAQRVWPMAVREGASGWASSAERRFSSLPARFSEVMPSSVTSATPAESYPRYSRRVSPSMTTSRAASSMVRPT